MTARGENPKACRAAAAADDDVGVFSFVMLAVQHRCISKHRADVGKTDFLCLTTKMLKQHGRFCNKGQDGVELKIQYSSVDQLVVRFDIPTINT